MVVYSVYLAAGALAAAGAATLVPPRALGSLVGSAPLFTSLLSSVTTAASKDGGGAGPLSRDSALSGLRLVPGLLLWYAALNLTSISYLFYLRVCHNLMGKDIRTGQIPWWSYVIFWPFHVVNLVLVYSKRFIFRRHVPLASEVLPDLWVGTYFSDVARAVEWQGIVDLTTEFSERSRARNYLCLPSWDGLPATDKDLTRGASFILEHWKQGPILCHCAAGIGRSATMVCAALILAEKASSVDEAEAMIREKRPIVRLNAKMRMALEAWSSNLDASRPNTDSAAATATTDM